MNLEDKSYTKFEVECLLTEQEFRYENKIIALKKDKEKLLNKIVSLKQEIAGIKKKIGTNGLGKNVAFDPKEKIGDYIKATEKNGFDLSEAYKVDDSELLEICKELGLTEKD